MHKQFDFRAGFNAALLLAAVMSCVPGSAFAAAADTAKETEFTPVVGQEGKDVIWVPTPDKTVEKMLTVANVGPKDFVIDLGSGDGRIVVNAAKLGARAFGVDMNPKMVKLSEDRAAKEGVTERAKFYVRDIFETDLRPATVVTMYLLPQLNMRLRPSILNLKPGTRIVSHAFDMGDWEPDVYDTSTGNSVRMWVVPAKVSGAWQWQTKSGAGEKPVVLELDQKFQHVSGNFKSAGSKMSLRDAKLQGDEISFTVIEENGSGTIRHDYSGHVNGNTIDGAVKSSNSQAASKWSATRKSAG
jgi:hypothetical protein